MFQHMLLPLDGTPQAAVALLDRIARAGGIEGTILAVADEVEADLIVMSTHVLKGPARTLLGSVADAVVRTARQPVLLIRRAVPGA
jgi:nucleotide-binding universal stress UspA family protein